MDRLHIIVYGMVQGVFFRANACREAARLGLRGWVRNRSYDAVEAVAEGPRPALEAFAAWCRHGPPEARVDRVDAAWEKATGAERDFHIAY